VKKEKDITLSLTDEAKDELGSVWYDPMFGARPLKRAIQKYILDPLSMEIIRGSVKEWDTVKIDYREKGFRIDV
jgi:ATP-dependent Clp protease ATP-binding subunit ClpB